MNRDAFTPMSFPENRFGRYEKLEPLGEGGMARVFRAYDPTLGRTVALKLLRIEDPVFAERHMLEARAQARIEHKHICKVYEVGAIEGMHYIAMQCIAGKTLKACLDEMTLEQKVKVIKQVAEAVHAAHRVGLIHRDLKPANVILERREDGEWIPYVMDFGLAREIGQEGLTQTGAVVGSPLYMSPEQAGGNIRALDRRTDIYSLGVTLYEMLTGKFPVEGDTSVDVLIKLCAGDPVPIRARDPAIPTDLQTIVMKCLERDPLRRYESARSLAEDLGRYLEGEPIQARPTSLAYRLLKKAKKHKAMVIIPFLTLVSIAIFVTMGIKARWASERQSYLAQQFGREVERIEGRMRVAQMLPLHDVRPEMKMVRERMKWIENQIGQFEAAGYGPGQYALGKGYLALHEYKKARTALEKAWESGYRDPEIAYSLGEVMGKLYQQALQDLEQIGSRELREVQRKEVEKTYKIPALQFLKQGSGTLSESPEYVEGLISFYEKRHDEALKKVEMAFRKNRWLYDARRLQGDIHVAIAQRKLAEDDYDNAATELNLAGFAYQEAIEIAASDSSVYEGDCERWIQALTLEADRGGNTKDAYGQALKSCDLALQANPDNGNAWNKKSMAYKKWGNDQYVHGKDPRASYWKGLEMAKQAARLNPSDVTALDSIGVCYKNLAAYEMERGMDPRKNLDRAIESFRHVIEINPRYTHAYNVLGLTYWQRGDFEKAHGFNPLASYSGAILTFQRAIRLKKDYVNAYINSGAVCQVKAEYEMQHGLNPQSSFDFGTKILQEAIRLDSTAWAAFHNLGSIYGVMGTSAMVHGKDPEFPLQKAIEAFRHALDISGERASHGGMGDVIRTRAAYHFETGRDPTALIRQAIQEYRESEEESPTPDFCVAVGSTYLDAALYQLEAGSDPVAFLKEARKQYETAAQLDSTNFQVVLLLAKIELASARSGSSIAIHLQNVEHALNEAVRLNPDYAETFLTFAEFHRRRSELANKQNQDIRDGLSMIERALKINPEYAEAYAMQGVLLSMQRDQPNADRAFSKALQLNPRLRGRYAKYFKSI